MPGPLRVLLGVSGMVGLAALAGVVVLVCLAVLAFVLPPAVTHIDILDGAPTASRSAVPTGTSSAEVRSRVTGPADGSSAPAATFTAPLAPGASPSPALPVVSGLSMTSGSLTGQQRVLITGRHLAPVTNVLFGMRPATSFTVRGDRKITAISPANVAGPVDITLTTPTGASAPSTADRFTYVSPPLVGSILPNTGATDGGTTVTITGIGFRNASAVVFGTAAADFTVLNQTTIQARPLAAPVGPVDIRVTGPYGTSARVPADVFTFVAPAAMMRVTPSGGPIGGGTQVMIKGIGFRSATEVDFGPFQAQFTVVSDTVVRAIAPAHAAGTVDITVTTPYGTSSTGGADEFTYTAPTATFSAAPAGPEE